MSSHMLEGRLKIEAVGNRFVIENVFSDDDFQYYIPKPYFCFTVDTQAHFFDDKDHYEVYISVGPYRRALSVFSVHLTQEEIDSFVKWVDDQYTTTGDDEIQVPATNNKVTITVG